MRVYSLASYVGQVVRCLGPKVFKSLGILREKAAAIILVVREDISISEIYSSSDSQAPLGGPQGITCRTQRGPRHACAVGAPLGPSGKGGCSSGADPANRSLFTESGWRKGTSSAGATPCFAPSATPRRSSSALLAARWTKAPPASQTIPHPREAPRKLSLPRAQLETREAVSLLWQGAGPGSVGSAQLQTEPTPRQ